MHAMLIEETQKLSLLRFLEREKMQYVNKTLKQLHSIFRSYILTFARLIIT
jgi:hypothetical protein